MPARGTAAARAHARAARSSACGPACRRPDARPARPACRSRSGRRPRTRSSSGMRCARGARRRPPAAARARCARRRSHSRLPSARAPSTSDMARLQPGLQAVARILREHARQRLVQAQAAELARHRGRERRDGRILPFEFLLGGIIFSHETQFTCSAAPPAPARRSCCGGCGLLPKEADETAGWSAQRLYGEAKDAMADRTGRRRSSTWRSSRRAIPTAATRSRRSSRSPTCTGRTASAPPRSRRRTASSSSTRTTPTSTTPGT